MRGDVNRPAVATSKRLRSFAFDLAASNKPTSTEPLACCDTFKRMPTAANVGTKDDPPYEINGSGIPFVGTNESTTLMLKSAWATRFVKIPRPKKTQNEQGTRR